MPIGLGLGLGLAFVLFLPQSLVNDIFEFDASRCGDEGLNGRQQSNENLTRVLNWPITFDKTYVEAFLAKRVN